MKNHSNLGSHHMRFIFLFVSLFFFNAVFSQEDGNTKYSTLVNFNAKGLQITRFDSITAAIDAHDGEIALFDGVYYLYGTSYDCGYEWKNENAPFCGFKVYSSRDLVNWVDNGFLFDAQTPVWQTRCNGKTYGCYRPHVIYNKKNNQYVLWINVYDNRVGFRVFTSSTPVGPFTEVAEPILSINNDAPVAGLNNGDHDTFVDDDGTAYIAYTDWRTSGTIIIDQLNSDYTSGTGRYVKDVTSGNTEAPSLMKRKGKYYILYSDPNCGYCAGTGTSYKTASSPLGPWSTGTKITSNSCGGQPAFVSVFNLANDTIYLYGSDLWNKRAANEALANFYWAPLEFEENGAIKPMVCQGKITLSIKEDVTVKPILEDLDNTSGADGFTTYCDISGNYQRGQSFVATHTGTLSGVSFMTSKSGYPPAGLTIEVYKATANSLPTGTVLSSTLVPSDSIGWSPKFVTVSPNIQVEAGIRYVMVIKTSGASGCYGLQYNDNAPYLGGGAIYSSNKGSSFVPEKNRTLMFRTFIHQNGGSGLKDETTMAFNVYPNPIKQYLNISLDGVDPSSEVKIVDEMGKEVLSQHITDPYSKNVTLNVSTLNNGMYIVKLENGTILKTVKIVKQ